MSRKGAGEVFIGCESTFFIFLVPVILAVFIFHLVVLCFLVEIDIEAAGMSRGKERSGDGSRGW